MSKYLILCLLLFLAGCKPKLLSDEYFDRTYISNFSSDLKKGNYWPFNDDRKVYISVKGGLKALVDVEGLKIIYYYYPRYFEKYSNYHDFLYDCFNQKLAIPKEMANGITLRQHVVWDEPFKLDQDIMQTYQTHGLEYLLNAFAEKPIAFLHDKEKVYMMRGYRNTKAATFFYLCFLNKGFMSYGDEIGYFDIWFPRQ